MYYVYEWVRSDLNLPYYVGKGKGKRAYDLNRNKFTDCVTKHLINNGLRRDVRIIAHFETEEAALEFEVERIAFWWHLKDHDVLTNQTLGGEGVSGYKHGPEQKEKMSKASKGKPKSESTRKKMAKNNWTKQPGASKIFARSWTEERREKYSQRMRGPNNHMHGKVCALAPAFGRINNDNQREAARKLGLSRTGENNPNYGKTPSAETIAKLSASNRGQKRSEETKNKMRKPRSPEGKAAIAASNRARAEKKRVEKITSLLQGDE
jgi:hypothetical protein